MIGWYWYGFHRKVGTFNSFCQYLDHLDRGLIMYRGGGVKIPATKEQLGRCCIKLMEEQGYSISDLAKLGNVSNRTIQRWMQRARKANGQAEENNHDQ